MRSNAILQLWVSLQARFNDSMYMTDGPDGPDDPVVLMGSGSGIEKERDLPMRLSPCTHHT